jgi:DNA-binding protein Alba
VAEEKPAEPAKVEKPQAPKEPVRRAEGNVVFIGKKPVMNYVIACVTFFNAGEKEVCIKARGRAISRAVDTVELLRRSFVKDLGLKEIKLGTEEMTREQGRKSNVSTIEITVAKTQ